MNNKTQKIKNATRKARKQNNKQVIKNILLFPVRVLKAIWNWLRSIDVVGMINLTLLVAIIVLFSSLISNFISCKKCDKKISGVKQSEIVMMQKQPAVDNRRVLKRKYNNTVLPVKSVKINENTNIRPQIRTVGVSKPQFVRELSLPAKELPKQTLNGDVIVDINPSSPILSNGVKVNGNLYIQNMRKYTIPCEAKINGHLFIRNVSKVQFCGKFTVNGNIYVNHQSSFGPIPEDALINGQIIL